MNFVFPLLLGGMAMVAIPIAIHLIMRQQPKTLSFPAFRFLVQKHRTNQRSLRLRHILLLLLRMSLLVLVCLALARPKIFSESLALTTDQPVAAILLFDTSMSMEYAITGGETRLDAAKKRALELLDELPSGSRYLILDTGDSNTTSRQEWLTSLPQVRQQIRGLQLRQDSGTVTARLFDAFRLFGDLAFDTSDGRGQQLPRVLVVLSDGMHACWDTTRTKALQSSVDKVPPSLPSVRVFAKELASRLELWKKLRKELPAPVGMDFSDQEVVNLSDQLAEKFDSVDPESYPSRKFSEDIAQWRGGLRSLADQIRQQKTEDYTDTQKAYREEILQSIADTLTKTQGSVNFFIDVGVADPIDLAIANVELPMTGRLSQPQQLFAPNAKVYLRAVIQSTGKEFASNVFCEGAGNALEQTIALAKDDKQSVAFAIDCRDLSSGPQQISVRTSSKDFLPFNNRRYVTFAIRALRDILVVAEDPGRAKLWAKAIEAREAARLRCQVMPVERFSHMDGEELAKYKAIYLLGLNNPTSKIWSLCQTYVNRGGGLAVIPGGKDMDLAAYNNDKIAKELLPGTLQKIIGPVDPGVVWNWDDESVFKHPLFRPIAEWKLQGQDDFIQIPRRANYYWQMQPEKENSATLVSYANADKTPALLERTFPSKQGKVLLFSTRLERNIDPAWSNYLNDDSSFIVVLPGLTTDYLSGDSDAVQFNFISGKEVPYVALPADLQAQFFLLRGPGMLDRVPRPTDTTVLQFKNVTKPGNYILEDSERNTIAGFSVNVLPEESILRAVPIAQIEDVLGAKAVMPLTHDMRVNAILQGKLQEPVELFPWLMLALLVFLACENLLANLFYRRQTAQ